MMSAMLSPQRHKITVEEYHKLGEAGVFAPDARIELIDGELVDMAPVSGPHIRTVNRLAKLFVLAVGDSAEVSIQNPVTLPPYPEPQPDLSLVSHGQDVPLADDTLLMIEVSDTTIKFDTGRKIPVYARARIPEVWIVDVNAKLIHVYRTLRENRYEQHFTVSAGETLSPEALTHVKIAVSEILDY